MKMLSVALGGFRELRRLSNLRPRHFVEQFVLELDDPGFEFLGFGYFAGEDGPTQSFDIVAFGAKTLLIPLSKVETSRRMAMLGCFQVPEAGFLLISNFPFEDRIKVTEIVLRRRNPLGCCFVQPLERQIVVLFYALAAQEQKRKIGLSLGMPRLREKIPPVVSLREILVSVRLIGVRESLSDFFGFLYCHRRPYRQSN